MSDPVIDVKIVSTFTMKDNNLVAAVSDSRAWVGWCGYRGVTLITNNGQKVKTVNTQFDFVCDLAVTRSGELLVTSYRGDKVKKLSLDGELTDLYVANAGYETHGITVTDDGEIIVCLYKLGDNYITILKLSCSGKLINTILYDSTCIKISLLDHPYRVSSNRNSDLILTQPYNSVVVLDTVGNRRFTYTGQMEGLRRTFNPHYTATDQCGHILISDCYNSIIHLLDKDGNFVQFIPTDEYDLMYPLGLSIDKLGRLWVCSYGNKQIIVLKYM